MGFGFRGRSRRIAADTRRTRAHAQRTGLTNASPEINGFMIWRFVDRLNQFWARCPVRMANKRWNKPTTDKTTAVMIKKPWSILPRAIFMRGPRSLSEELLMMAEACRGGTGAFVKN